MLAHPEHASLDCRDCQQWIYDIETAKPKLRGGKRQRRAHGQPTPCHECPKESPEKWSVIEPTERTLETLNLYRRNRAMFGRVLNDAEADDPFLQEMFARLDMVFDEVKHARQQQSIFELIAATTR